VNMKIAIQPPEDHHFSIMQRILDGKLTITSPDEFLEILGIYKEDPFLHRKYADLLNDLKRHDEAVEFYATAARLFIAKQMNLQAVVAKILQWSIQKAGHHQGRAFYALLHEEGGRQTPLQRFWARLSYAELVAFMRRLVRVRLKPGMQASCVNQPAEALFFVVSGTLCETPSPECTSESERNDIEIEPVLLGTNDIFGDVFPLHEPTVSDAEIRTISDVELVKITKPVLRDVCDKYPRIGSLLQGLRKPERQGNCDRSWQTVRRAFRYGLPTKVEMLCPSMKPDQKIIQHKGIATDLSLGGMCMELTDMAPAAQKTNLKGRLVQINLDLLNDVVLLNLTGKIVWQRRQNRQKGAAMLIGIRFDTLSKMDQDMLSEYCSGSVGEQNLLWSLWDSMIKSDIFI
jgi:hypothetical protein